MGITGLAIEKNRVTIVLLLVVAAAGIWTYLSMPRAEDPGFIIRFAQVVTYFPGASPERVEQLVTDKLEKAIREIPELDFVSSESKTGLSVIMTAFKDRYVEMRPIFDDLRRKVERAAADLPEGVIGPDVDDEYGDVFGIIISVSADAGDFEYAEIKHIADEVRDELLLLPDVAKVDIYGAQDERIFVEYNNARLSELGLSPMQLQTLLESQNIIIPGGEIRTEYETIVLEPSGNFESLEQVQRSVIAVPGRRDVLFLEDVAQIRRGYVDPPTTKMRSSGATSLGLAVSMREGGNVISLGEQVREVIDLVRAVYPIGIDFDTIQFQPDAVDALIRGFARNLVQAVAIVTLVMLISLGLRTGLLVASLIPMAMISALMVMGFFDIGLDQMSIASLIIALGMLVDNAIVMSESILVQMSAGKRPLDAAIDSAAELRIPLLTSSLTTAAAFLPIYLADSTTGEYTAPLFKVVTITLLCSWVLALTMIPMLCVRFLRVTPSPDGDSFDTRFYRLYRGALLVGLRRRWVALAVVALVFAVAMLGFGKVPAIFFPPNERPTFTAELALPLGTPLAATERVVDRVEQYVRGEMQVGEKRERGVTGWGSFIGTGAPRYILPYSPEPPRPDYAYLILNATDRQVIDELIPAFESFCTQTFPGLKSLIAPLQLGPPAWPPIELRLSGRDTDRLFDIVEQVKERLEAIPGTKLIDDNWGARSKKLIVRVNQPRARRAGVSSQDVAISLQTFLSGLEVTEFREDDELIPVTLRSVVAERQDIDKLETLNVYAQATGESVPLKQVADVEIVWQPSVIHRYNRLRTVTVEAAVQPGFTAAEVVDQLRPWLKRQSKHWGLGYSYEFGGEEESSVKANRSIAAKLPVAGLIIVLLLVGQFNSFRRPLIILLTIPLSLIGVVFGLLVARSYFGFMTLLGIISLAGIVINNAIVLIDRIRIEIDQNGHPPARAIIEAAQRRLRPIVLTTVTTVGGLTPLWLGGGPMWEPMAIGIIFGLVFATALTLGVVPILYAILFRVDFKRFRYAPSAGRG
jgi:multidrug efflux pump subunit AcrB